MFVFHGEVLLHPNSYMFGDSADALKNYYTFAYHVAHDTSALQFEGMNQPYGEHIIYTDAQPAFSIPLQKLALVFPSIKGHTIGIMNLLLLFDLPLCVLLFSLVLLKYGAPPWLSVLGALGIALLSPQVLRMQMHYALSYSSFFPLVWFLVLQLRSSAKPLKWWIVLTLVFCALFWVHPYLGMIAVMFTIAFSVVELLRSSLFRKKLGKREYAILLSSFLAIGLFKLALALSDHHSGRTVDPGGTLEYVASWASVLKPYHTIPMPITGHLIPGGAGNWEGSAYWGIGTMLGIGIFLISLFWRPARRAITNLLEDPSLFPALIAAFILLFISFGWHLVIPFIKDGPLLQFRSLGRFAWPAYYVLGVTFVIILFHLSIALKKIGERRWAQLFAVLLPLCMIYEGTFYHTLIDQKARNTTNPWRTKMLSDSWGAFHDQNDADQYNVIIPLPFFHNGSGQILLLANAPTMRAAFSYSLYSGIPLMASDLARTSIPEARNIVQALGAYAMTSPIKDMYDDTHVALVLSYEPIQTAAQKRMLEKCNRIGKYGGMTLFSIRFADLFKDRTDEVLNKFLKAYPDPKLWDGRILYDSTSFIPFRNFEDLVVAEPVHGIGSLIVPRNERTALLKVAPNTLLPGQQYVLSLWVDMGEEMDQYGMLFVERKDTLKKTASWDPVSDVRSARELNGRYSMVEMLFTPNSNTAQYTLYLYGIDAAVDSIIFDDVLLRPLDSDVYSLWKDKEGAWLMHNGLYYHVDHNLLRDTAVVGLPDLP